MGIDVPPFRSGVDRPEDAAAKRGAVITRGVNDTVQPGNSVIRGLFVNSASSRRFLQTVNVAQRPRSSQPVQDDVFLEISVVNSNGIQQFSVVGTGGSLSKVLPGLPVRPTESVISVVDNESSSTIDSTASISLRTE
jgi:hypothetical protein